MSTSNLATLLALQRAAAPPAATLDAWALAARGRQIGELLNERPNGYAVSALMHLEAGATVTELAKRLTGVLNLLDELGRRKGYGDVDR